MSNTNYLKATEAADALGVSRETIRRWVKTGKVEAIRTLGGHLRVEKSTIEELIKLNTTNGNDNGAKAHDNGNGNGNGEH